MTDTRNADYTFAAGDTIGFVAGLGTPAPNAFEDLAAPWICLGWIDTGGYIYKLAEALKDVNASGTLDPIRTITTGAPKSLQANFLEPLNPAVRSLYDDVPMALLQPAVGTTVAAYNMPEVPSDLRYCFLFDTIDSDKQVRLFAPNGKITARGDDQPQQADAEMLDMTVQFYPANVGGIRTAVRRYVNYGSLDLTPFFT
jgi:hypothetical protein